MKRFFCFFALCLLTAAPGLRADDTTPLPPPTNPNSAAAIATRQDAEQSYNILKGQMDDLVAAQVDRDKQIQELKRAVEELRQQISKPSDKYASQEDLKQLANAIAEIDKKREADKELILKEFEKLGQAVGSSTSRVSPHNPDSGTSSHSGDATATNPDQTGFYYTVKKDDTVGLIAQAYREQGVKVTSKQIEEANPNLNPAKLRVGMKIFIPAPKGTTLK